MNITDSAPSTFCGALQMIALEGNWKTKGVKEPQFLLMGMGDKLEDIAARFSEAVIAADAEHIKLGQVAEFGQSPGRVRAIRVVQEDRKVHRTATDVILRRQADDLFVKFQVVSRSWLIYLRFALYATTAVVSWCLLYGMFFTMTDTRESIVQNYARQWSDSSAASLREAELSGFRYDETQSRFVATAPVSMGEIFKRDPKLFLTQLAGPPTIIAGLIALVLRFAPRSFLRIPCRVLDWPTPDEFDALVVGHAAWTEGILSLCLLRHWGIDERVKIAVK